MNRSIVLIIALMLLPKTLHAQEEDLGPIIPNQPLDVPASEPKSEAPQATPSTPAPVEPTYNTPEEVKPVFGIETTGDDQHMAPPPAPTEEQSE